MGEKESFFIKKRSESGVELPGEKLGKIRNEVEATLKRLEADPKERKGNLIEEKIERIRRGMLSHDNYKVWDRIKHKFILTDKGKNM